MVNCWGRLGLSVLNMVLKAKELLDRAEKISPEALDGSVYTFQGSLYYRVPCWPVALGDKERALAAPSQPERPIFDGGRREEIRMALAEPRKIQQ